MQEYDWIVTTPPPTPNGDLHVGHISGPYLAADVFKRVAEARKERVHHVCYGDANQSYVETSALQKGVESEDLVETSNSKIKQALKAYSIDCNYYDLDDDFDHYIRTRIDALCENEAIVNVELTLPYKNINGDIEVLLGSKVTGACRNCLSESKGLVCEVCYHPNHGSDLLHCYESSRGPGAIKLDKISVLVFRLERYRKYFERFYVENVSSFSEKVRSYFWEVMSKPLPDIPVCYPSSRGISYSSDKGENFKVNAWFEMGIRLAYLGSEGFGQKTKVSQFLGIDNIFFFLFLGPATQVALDEGIGVRPFIPDWIYTNCFLNLNNQKFSTSKDHLIWAIDLAKSIDPRYVRFYLSLHAPLAEEQNFCKEDALNFMRMNIEQPLRRIVGKFGAPKNTNFLEIEKESFSSVVNRFEHYADPKYFSHKKLAEVLQQLIRFIDSNMNNSDTDLSIEYAFLIRKIDAFMPNLFTVKGLENAKNPT